MTATAFHQKKTAYPLRFVPQYKDYLWGGDRIIRHFHRSAPRGIYAESWEASIRPEGPSIIANGPLVGTPLADLFPAFPLLLKILDARETLSVQVHPDEAAATSNGGEPKTETWYILAAAPGAFVYCGLKPGTDEPALRAALAAGTLVTLLEKIPVVAGDTIFVPGGRVHAIGAGCLLLECQQNSNTTYRLYDWNRTTPDGKTRELHIEQSLRTINWNDTSPLKTPTRPLPPLDGNPRQQLLTTPHFTIERIALQQAAELPADSANLRLLFLAEGTIKIHSPTFTEIAPLGTTYLLPPALPSLSLTPRQPATLILITAPYRVP